MKNSFLPLIAVSLFLVFATGCGEKNTTGKTKYHSISGATMGTTYNITFADSLDRDVQPAIDDLLKQINQEVSTYIDTSVISRFNQTAQEFPLEGNLYASSLTPTRDRHFRYNFGFAKEVYKTTGGAFDPTVMPLVNYWGFGFTEKKPVTEVDSALVDSLMVLVGFDKIKYQSTATKNILIKESPGIQLDFSALAKGYTVDEIGRYLEQAGINNFLVEIGGEVVCKGKNPHKEWWKIGINTPEENKRQGDIFSTITLQNQAMATSGNYRNYYKVGQTSYAHTINPQTGFPEKSTLLSVTVLAESCILADAYATAFMVMGLEKSFQLASELPGLEAYFIYSGENGELVEKYTDGMKPFLN